MADGHWEQDKARFVDDATRAAAEDRDPLPDHGNRLGPLALQFVTLTYALLDATTVAEVLEQVVQTAARVIPGADIVSVTLRDPHGRYTTPVATDPVADQLDQLQYTLDEGPCVDACCEDGPAVATSQDLGPGCAWPRFGPQAAQFGVRAVLSVALVPTRPSGTCGALNAYSRRIDGLQEADQHVMLLLASHAALAVAHTEAVELAELKQANLQRALDSRDVIGQAKGILMARQKISADEAFDILRRTSQELNTKLLKIAETLIGRHHDL